MINIKCYNLIMICQKKKPKKTLKYFHSSHCTVCIRQHIVLRDTESEQKKTQMLEAYSMINVNLIKCTIIIIFIKIKRVIFIFLIIKKVLELIKIEPEYNQRLKVVEIIYLYHNHSFFLSKSQKHIFLHIFVKSDEKLEFESC